MTIIRPNKKINEENNIGFYALIGVLLSMIILSMFFYNVNVDLRYLTESLSEDITRLEAESAELHDTIYRQLDFGNLEAVAKSFGLVREGKPEYLLAFQ
jgi:hypothetical protein